MARHLSVIVILAIAGFLVFSFMTSFGDKTGQIRQVLPVKGATERPPADAIPISPNVQPDTKANVGADTKAEVKEDVKDVKVDTKADLKSDFAPLPADILAGGAIAPKLENATLKYAPDFYACRPP